MDQEYASLGYVKVLLRASSSRVFFMRLLWCTWQKYLIMKAMSEATTASLSHAAELGLSPDLNSVCFMI